MISETFKSVKYMLIRKMNMFGNDNLIKHRNIIGYKSQIITLTVMMVLEGNGMIW